MLIWDKYLMNEMVKLKSSFHYNFGLILTLFPIMILIITKNHQLDDYNQYYILLNENLFEFKLNFDLLTIWNVLPILILRIFTLFVPNGFKIEFIQLLIPILSYFLSYKILEKNINQKTSLIEKSKNTSQVYLPYLISILLININVINIFLHALKQSVGIIFLLLYFNLSEHQILSRKLLFILNLFIHQINFLFFISLGFITILNKFFKGMKIFEPKVMSMNIFLFGIYIVLIFFFEEIRMIILNFFNLWKEWAILRSSEYIIVINKFFSMDSIISQEIIFLIRNLYLIFIVLIILFLGIFSFWKKIQFENFIYILPIMLINGWGLPILIPMMPFLFLLSESVRENSKSNINIFEMQKWNNVYSMIEGSEEDGALKSTTSIFILLTFPWEYLYLRGLSFILIILYILISKTIGMKAMEKIMIDNKKMGTICALVYIGQCVYVMLKYFFVLF